MSSLLYDSADGTDQTSTPSAVVVGGFGNATRGFLTPFAMQDVWRLAMPGLNVSEWVWQRFTAVKKDNSRVPSARGFSVAEEMAACVDSELMTAQRPPLQVPSLCYAPACRQRPRVGDTIVSLCMPPPPPPGRIAAVTLPLS